MKKSRFTPELIIGFIKQADAGKAAAELAQQHGFSPTSSTTDGPSRRHGRAEDASSSVLE